MKRIAVFILLLTISTWAVAQTQSSSNPGPGTQTYVAPGVVAGPGGLSTNTGTAVILAPPSTPLLVTPEVHLTTVTPATGATNATPGNNAGAANATAAMPAAPRTITTVPQFSAVTQTVPPQEGTATSAPAFGGSAAANTTGVGAPVAVNNALLFDRGVGPNSSLVAGGTGGQSLAEIARQNRQHEGGTVARTYTNEDINRINAQPGTTGGGMSGAAVGAGNATQQQTAPSGNVPAVAQPQTPPNPPTNPGVTQPVPPTSNTPPPEQSQADHNQLPSGGSILPLMAVVGVLATGAGLLAR